MKPKTRIVDETPEPAIEGISAALNFLQREAEAIGMSEVSALINRARAKIKISLSPQPGLSPGDKRTLMLEARVNTFLRRSVKLSKAMRCRRQCSAQNLRFNRQQRW